MTESIYSFYFLFIFFPNSGIILYHCFDELYFLPQTFFIVLCNNLLGSHLER